MEGIEEYEIGRKFWRMRKIGRIGEEDVGWFEEKLKIEKIEVREGGILEKFEEKEKGEGEGKKVDIGMKKKRIEGKGKGESKEIEKKLRK